jgi:hypothetical protein
VENFATVVELVQCPNKMAKTGYCTLKPDFQKASLILTARGFPGRFFFEGRFSRQIGLVG